MKPPFRIVCRGSRLSLAQADIFKKRLEKLKPQARVEIIIKETRGDANLSIPLDEIEGKDFFTKDIQDYLVSGQADFAVHSLKDVSGENFFSGTHYAIVERDDPRDAAIFSKTLFEKLRAGTPLKLGTSSPRRVELAVKFLQRALPTLGNQTPRIEALPIRGNVDTRLQKLSSGQYDGVVLACAGLNRLLRADQQGEVAGLLRDKHLLILPLLHCPPAPGQGAIVVETTPDNVDAVAVLQGIADSSLAKQVILERKVAHYYGSGCHQKFGAIHMHLENRDLVYASGKDRKGNDFSENYGEDGLATTIQKVSTAVDPADLAEHNVWLALNNSTPPGKGRVWVAETETWFDLASRGYWVEGSLEGHGLNFNEYTIRSPLLNIPGGE